jgi:DNA-binding response OmpR family regulator
MTEMTPLRVLVVEDEVMIAFYIEDCLIRFGHQVVGLASRVDKALSLIKTEEFDLALLDVNVANEEVYPAAQELRSRGIPFMFLSGYGTRGLREEWKDSPMLEKPFAPEILEARIDAVMQHA